MSSFEVESSPRSLFGVPASQTHAERSTLIADLTALWISCYGSSLSDLHSDLNRCRHFFDPVARGQSLRSRLTEVNPAPTDVQERINSIGSPLAIDAGDGVVLVGVEARLLIDALKNHQDDSSKLGIPESVISDTERTALDIYRTWTLHRLTQVIDLRNGRGKEPMQPVAVGLVIALLVNRSTTPDRALIQRDHHTTDGKDVDFAIHAGAEAFANALATSRKGRSSGEQRLKGGYPLTEARRRLAHRLLVVAGNKPNEKLIFVPETAIDDVIRFLGSDLARRETVSSDNLEHAYKSLVTAFTDSTQALAYRSMVFDRKAETLDLGRRLLESFVLARQLNAHASASR
ncbi:hypothetical protein [Nonomuraea dietziae]|uniref:hypothetical protein n=1 Tax=Nonomuraea dietziae TaxID=65515 RepID=UPI003434E22B